MDIKIGVEVIVCPGKWGWGRLALPAKASKLKEVGFVAFNAVEGKYNHPGVCSSTVFEKLCDF